MKIFDKILNQASKKPEGIAELTAKEFSARRLGEIHLQKIEGMTIGLIEFENREYTQIFISREVDNNKTLVSVNDRYATDILAIADKYRWNFLEKDPTTIIFEKDIQGAMLIYCTSRNHVLNYRQEIDNQVRSTQTSNAS